MECITEVKWSDSWQVVRDFSLLQNGTQPAYNSTSAGALSPQVKWQLREAQHSTPSMAENEWSYTPTRP